MDVRNYIDPETDQPHIYRHGVVEQEVDRMVQSGSTQEIKVTLLGTGTPVPAMNRFGPSTLVEADGQTFLFDAGRGAMQRLAQLRVRWQDVDALSS